MKLPIRVPNPDNKDEVLVLNTEQEAINYQHRVHSDMTKVRNFHGEPEPNFSVGPCVGLSPEDCRKLSQTTRLF